MPRARYCIGSTLLCCLLLILACGPVFAAPDPGAERDLWNIWKQQNAGTNAHAEIIAACQAFEKTYPNGELVPVLQTLAAWHQLQLGQVAEARSVFAKCLEPRGGGISRAATEISRAWTTRLDILDLKKPLEFYYRREIEYPPSLAKLAGYKHLPAEMKPTLIDRWKLPFDYRLAGLRTMKLLRGQGYIIKSQKLGDYSDLSTALSLPYGEAIQIEFGRVRRQQSGGELIEVRSASTADKSLAGKRLRPATLNEGSKFGDVTLAYIGSNIVVVGDVNHWKIYPKPR